MKKQVVETIISTLEAYILTNREYLEDYQIRPIEEALASLKDEKPNYIRVQRIRATGIVRRMDDLGRVVVPKEMRRALKYEDNQPLELMVTAEGHLLFKKYPTIQE